MRHFLELLLLVIGKRLVVPLFVVFFQVGLFETGEVDLVTSFQHLFMLGGGGLAVGPLQGWVAFRRRARRVRVARQIRLIELEVCFGHVGVGLVSVIFDSLLTL